MTTRTNPFELDKYKVLVTGGSSGIGRETAILLSELGCTVVITARRSDRLESTLGQMRPGAHTAELFDLTNLEAIPEWVRTLANRHGPFDAIIHAAGVRTTSPLRVLSVEAFQQTFRINVDSAMMLAKGFRQKGCHKDSSGLVFLSSAAALVGSSAISAYAASKAALIGLAKSLAIELAREGIRVNCIAPGVVESEMTEEIRRTLSEEQFCTLVAQHPLGLGSTRDVACAAAYLISGAGRWITGHTLVIDGGFSAQ